LDTLGTPHSDALRVVERFGRVRPDRLEIGFLFEDPKAFTKPWTGKKGFDLRKDWEIIEHEGYCGDRAREEFERGAALAAE
jgi:hypothetical protein